MIKDVLLSVKRDTGNYFVWRVSSQECERKVALLAVDAPIKRIR